MMGVRSRFFFLRGHRRDLVMRMQTGDRGDERLLWPAEYTLSHLVVGFFVCFLQLFCGLLVGHSFDKFLRD